MKRIAYTLVAMFLMMVAVPIVNAQTSPLVNKVYTVTIKGQINPVGPGVPFTPRPGLVVIFPSQGPGHPFEVCLYSGNPNPLDFPITGSGSVWLATWLKCGTNQALPGNQTGPFTSPNVHITGLMQTSSDLSYVSIIPNVPGPYAVLYASESSFVYENIFSEGYVSQTTFDWILGGSWYLYTRDGGKTISGGMKLMGAPAYTGLTFGIIQYVATFTGSLIGQIGQ